MCICVNEGRQEGERRERRERRGEKREEGREERRGEEEKEEILLILPIPIQHHGVIFRFLPFLIYK